jgi:hypothetical protein
VNGIDFDDVTFKRIKMRHLVCNNLAALFAINCTQKKLVH